MITELDASPYTSHGTGPPHFVPPSMRVAHPLGQDEFKSYEKKLVPEILSKLEELGPLPIRAKKIVSFGF